MMLNYSDMCFSITIYILSMKISCILDNKGQESGHSVSKYIARS